jgi:hypothetical protein
MSTPPPEDRPQQPAAPRKAAEAGAEDRRAAALRANLARRKAQARARKAQTGAQAAPEAPPDPGASG